MISTIQRWAAQIRQTGRVLRWSMILLPLLASLGSVASREVEAQTPNEYRVKAAFILNFARFIEWPADGYGDGGALIVGIVGDDPFGGSLDQLNGTTVNGHRIVIRRLKAGDYLKGCQILFVSSSERNRLGKILESVRGGSVLTIGELSQFNQAGGIIKFVIQDNKVRFEINDGAAGQARLRISSKLLALSKSGRN
jgi:hypothetical protein